MSQELNKLFKDAYISEDPFNDSTSLSWFIDFDGNTLIYLKGKFPTYEIIYKRTWFQNGVWGENLGKKVVPDFEISGEVESKTYLGDLWWTANIGKSDGAKLKLTTKRNWLLGEAEPKDGLNSLYINQIDDATLESCKLKSKLNKQNHIPIKLESK